jgi:hypothetical protein
VATGAGTRPYGVWWGSSACGCQQQRPQTWPQAKVALLLLLLL